MNNTKSNERSAQPIKGLSERAQRELQSRRFHVYGKAHPKQGSTAA
jgi:hypothetical protein